MVLVLETGVRVLIGQLRVKVRVAQHRFGVALSVKFFGRRKRSGIGEGQRLLVRKSSSVVGGESSRGGTGFLGVCEIGVEQGSAKKSIWRGASVESECDQGL